ncbi:CHASE3 domain-containing protein [Actinomadura sp. DC4]|uniref:CHASE3 domain-containing protein n=1 Tax=Actinomadura sp. DC4 TaxID=3055069 RepID=UPI0025B09D1E|nr:CHASE3 domain-containing protein [Actinomadura sp. DC4]MDN3351543.1 CHASE3 domain-containing protein [Actinomadura sp. DC4]
MGARALRRLRSRSDPRGGLTRRIVFASGIVVLLAIGAYALLFAVIIDLRDSADVANRSKAILSSANRLERLVTDLETGVRGFIITGDKRLLAPLGDAQNDVIAEGRSLVRLTAKGDPGQAGRARQIVRDTEMYVRDYSIPLVTEIRADPGSARSMATIAEGEQRLQPLRARFDLFMATQSDLIESDESRASRDATKATIIAAAGAGGALALLLLFSGYLRRAILRPVRRTSAMASNLAGGDLSVRIPEVSRNDVGVLERTFNVMAGSLQADRQQLRRVVEEQGALRRIATLIARGVSPAEIFTAVASELGRIQGMEYAVVNRFEPGLVATAVGHWTSPGAPDIMPPVSGRWPVEDQSAAAQIIRTLQPARVNTDRATSTIGVWSRVHGIRYVVGCPITVSGHLWGMIAVFSLDHEPPPEDTEERLVEFVELLATAIANAENRNELLASSARIVAAADEARRRVERNLNTGPQRRLTALGEDLRVTQATVDPRLGPLREHLARTVRGLDSVLDDLREISRGLHPATLSRSGLRNALEALTQRSEVPAALNARIGRNLPDHIQVAIYYTVSEALTNVAKYSQATSVHIDLSVEETTLRLRVNDDGVGGADPTRGSGLLGLKDRIESLGGTIKVVSPSGGGTSLLVEVPVPPP